MSRAEADPASFRDPAARVFLLDGEVHRALGAQALADWRALAASQLYARERETGHLVGTAESDRSSAPPGLLADDVAGVLRHETLPFVSYPYEWSFSMLQDAALLHLRLLRAALAEDLVLKDGTPYNVQWRGSRPVFVDIASFERMREPEPWAGYRQFCMLFLYPLLLQAHRGIPFQPLLRGRLEGIAPAEARSMLRPRDMLRRGVATHVHLHARLERRHGHRSGEVRAELRRAGFRKELVDANARKLERVVGGLRWRAPETAWSTYREESAHLAADAGAKEAFVRSVTASRHWAQVWDLGANDGHFSRIAAESADSVVAIDGDHATVDALYRELSRAGDERILPLVCDLADPSPGLGWRGRERRAFGERGDPELVLCLALVHHLAIGRNVPLDEVVDWLAEPGGTVVVELPTREDAMVQRLIAAKAEGVHDAYGRAAFERALEDRFEVLRSETLPSGTRVLYHAAPRGRTT